MLLGSQVGFQKTTALEKKLITKSPDLHASNTELPQTLNSSGPVCLKGIRNGCAQERYYLSLDKARQVS